MTIEKQNGPLSTAAASEATRPPAVAFVYLAIIIVSWAGNWPLMKIALGQIPPLVFVLLRLVGSLILIAPVLLAARAETAAGQGRAGEAVLDRPIAGRRVSRLQQHRPVDRAGRAGDRARYTMPLWAIPIGLFLWPEPLGRSQLLGAAIGFAGLVLFMRPGLVDWSDRDVLAGNALLLLAAFTWALGSCLYRRQAWRSPFWAQTFWQLAASLVPVVAVASFQTGDASIHWSPALAAIVVYNCVVTTALGYFLWGKVLSMMSAATAGQVLTLTPVGGFALSLAMFGGALTADIVVSIALIVAGIAVTLRRRG